MFLHQKGWNRGSTESFVPYGMEGFFLLHKNNIKVEVINMEKSMEKVVALAKNRGFVYPGSEIYGGLSNTWDYIV